MEVATLSRGWKRVKFGDVVRQVKQTVKDPLTSGLTRVVGLEHLDSDSLSLTRWTELSDLPDGTSFTRVFRAGQVLFGKRRAYQRKVAVADFDGVCSGDILVLEPCSNDLVPEFLPFLVLSDGFYAHALGTSAGSLSPRTKWQELAKYEFELPPIPNQRESVDELQAASRLQARLSEVAANASVVAGSLVAGVVSSAGSTSLRTLADCCRAPISYGIVQPGPPVPGGVPFVNVEDMTAGPLRRQALPTTAPEISARHRRTTLATGDVIVALRGPIGLTAEIPEELAEVNLSRGIARLAPRPDVSTSFLAACFGTPYVTSQIAKTATGSTFKELKIGALREIRIPVPPADIQKAIARSVDAAKEVTMAAEREVRWTQSLRRALLNGAVTANEL
jgi:type I restriction enzyme S subunit